MYVSYSPFSLSISQLIFAHAASILQQTVRYVKGLVWRGHGINPREILVPCTTETNIRPEDAAHLQYVFSMADGDIYRSITGPNHSFLVAWQDDPNSDFNLALLALCPYWPVTVNLLILQLDDTGRPVDIRGRRSRRRARRVTAK